MTITNFTSARLMRIQQEIKNFKEGKVTQEKAITGAQWEGGFKNLFRSSSSIEAKKETIKTYFLTQIINTKLTSADLRGADLTHADLRGADLRGADLTHADLTRADLRGAYLTEANFTRAYLTEAYLTEAYLTEANLTGANLTGANLTGADLTDTNLTDTHLTGANLTGANLTDTNLTGATFDFEIMNSGTVEILYAHLNGIHGLSVDNKDGITHCYEKFISSDIENAIPNGDHAVSKIILNYLK